MMRDGRGLDFDSSMTADVCIVGGGPAGMTLALELDNTDLDIVLLESGGQTSDLETQELYSAKNIGIDYEPLDKSRSRFFGGSSNCWGGWCRPLDDIDFEQRDWMPDSGWPFGRAELVPFYIRAHDYLGLGPFDYSEYYWSEELKTRNIDVFDLKNSAVMNQIVQFSPPVRFGKTYYERCAGSRNVQFITWANVTQIEASDFPISASNVRVRTLTGNQFIVKARYVVLAAGGIESARILLHSNRLTNNRLGNDHDLVGRYFMDHPRLRSSTFILNDSKRHRQLYDNTVAGTRHRSGVNPNKIAAHLAPTCKTQRSRRLPNSRTFISGRYAFDETKSFKMLKALRSQILYKRHFGSKVKVLSKELVTALLTLPVGLAGIADVTLNPALKSRRFTLQTVMEPIPHRDSRVFILDEKDRLGVHKACLDWRLTEQDRLNILATTDLVRGEMAAQKIGTQVDALPGRSSWDGAMVGCWHHMGTTRMHDDPRKGVVDRHLKVHGVTNLYCVGSSVFPTAGSDCPTITLVALAIRLADRLKAIRNSVAA